MCWTPALLTSVDLTGPLRRAHHRPAATGASPVLFDPPPRLVADDGGSRHQQGLISAKATSSSRQLEGGRARILPAP
jgi:hypothetical protein